MILRRLITACVFLLLTIGLSSATSKNVRAKYVFYFIGDGMGLVQAQLADEFIKAEHGRDTGLAFFTFPARSFVTTFAQNRLITGSAAAGTALATGHKTSVNTIGKNTDRSCNILSVSSMCSAMGMKTGVLSSVFINHATPASFYAHADDRNNLYDMSMQIPASGIDFFAGGDILHPRGADGNEPDAYLAAQKAGYAIPLSLAGIDSVSKGQKILFTTGKALGTDILSYRINRPASYPSLGDLTVKAIDRLYGPAGFIIMVEGGAIDWNCHENDAASAIQETIDMDLAVREALRFYRAHPHETLIIVTADHETGGMALGCSQSAYQSDLLLLKHQKASLGIIEDTLKKVINAGADFEKSLALIGQYTGLGTAVPLSNDEKDQLKTSYGHCLYYLQGNKKQYTDIYGGKNPMVVCALKMLACKAGVGWTSYAHTAAAVPVYAIGVGTENFANMRDNTQITQFILQQVTGTSQQGTVVCPPAK